MKIRKSVTAGLATAGLAAGTLFAAAPAQADSLWSDDFNTYEVCIATTAAKIASLSVGHDIQRSVVCRYNDDPFYYNYSSMIQYR